MDRVQYYITYTEAALFFTLIPCFFVWGSILRTLCALILAVLLIYDIVKYGANKTKAYSILFVILYGYLAVISGKNMNGMMVTLSVVPVFFLSEKRLLSISDSFRNIFAFFAVPSLIFYLLFLSGVGLPGVYIPALNPLKSGYYTLYPFFVYYFDIIPTLRFQYLFDEPGVVGTIAGLLLMTGDFNMRKWQNIAIFVAGFLSFSLFFNLVTAYYIVTQLKVKQQVGVLVVIAGLLYLFRNNEVLNLLVFDRISLEDGQLFVNNRLGSSSFESYYESFTKTNDYYWGLGPGTASEMDPKGSSYTHVILDYGLYFFVTYMLSFYLYAFRKLRGIRHLLIFSMCLIGTMYQRPFINQIPLILLILASSCLSEIKTYQQDGK